MKHTTLPFFSPRLTLGLAAAALLLGGCGLTHTVSHKVDEHGMAEEIIFPKVEDISAVPEGVWPNMENLQKVGAGMTEDDLYALLGRPHFSEGFAAREWDYLFKFRQPAASTTPSEDGRQEAGLTVQDPQLCQFKVIFDKDKKARAFWWLPASCTAHGPGLGCVPKEQDGRSCKAPERQQPETRPRS